MTSLSISFGERQGTTICADTVCGRVELLGGNGEVVQSWEIRPGRWTLGAASQNNIVLSGDPTVEDLHAVFTVGKKYTLVKAHGPIRIGERFIREYLIDQSTLLECGSQRLVIHPYGRAAVSVVTSDRITDVASKLAKAASGSTPIRRAGTSSSGISQPQIDFHAATSELKGELERLRSSLNTIQTRLETIPTLESWDQRIDQLSNRSIAAIEQELGEKIREPLRDELVQFIQDQQPPWSVDLKTRIRSLESHVGQLEEQWGETLLHARQDLNEFYLRLSDLIEDQKSLRGLLDQYGEQNSQVVQESSRLEPSSDSVPYPSDSDADFPSDSSNGAASPDDESYEETSDSEAYPWGSDVHDSDSNYDSDQAIEDDLSAESDEVVEFKVDDESISLRLNRMLGEHVERRNHREDSEQVHADVRSDSPQFGVSERSDESEPFGVASSHSQDVLMSVDQDGSGSISLSEVYSPIESSSRDREFSRGTQEVSTGGDRVNSGPSFADQRGQGDSANTPEEESIEEYMQRLLQRVRTGPATAETSSVTKKEPTKGSSSVRASEPTRRTGDSDVESPEATGQTAKSKAATVKQPPKPIEEVKSDLAALRELANTNARRAINRSAIRRTSSKGLAKTMLTVVALICGAALFFTPGIGDGTKYGGIGVSLIIALLWAFEALREIAAMLFQRKQRKEDQAPERELRKGAKSPNTKAAAKA